MKKKIIIVLVLVMILSIIGVFVCLKLFKKEDVKLTYLDNVMAASTQTKYLSSTLPDVLNYLKNHEITEKTDFSKMNITKSTYKDCTGTVSAENGAYLVSAECPNGKKDGYNINYTVSSGKHLKSLIGITNENNEHVYYGVSDDSKVLIVGNLDNNMNIKWETRISNTEDGNVIIDVNHVSDGYLVFVLNALSDDDYNLEVIKLDKNGKIIKRQSIKESSTIYNTSNDITVVSQMNKSIILLDKDGNVLLELPNISVQAATIQDDIIYYIDSNKEMHLIDTKGKEIKKIQLESSDEKISKLEIVNNKIFAVEEGNIIIYDMNGHILKTNNYSNLSVDKSIYNGEHNQTMIMDITRNNNDIYVNAMLENYQLVDHYDENLTLVNRNIYEMTFSEANDTPIYDTIILGEKPFNINYSNKNGMFFCTNYID